MNKMATPNNKPDNPEDQDTDSGERDYYSKDNILYVGADKEDKEDPADRGGPTHRTDMLASGARDVEMDRDNDFGATITGRYGRTAKDFNP